MRQPRLFGMPVSTGLKCGPFVSIIAVGTMRWSGVVMALWPCGLVFDKSKASRKKTPLGSKPHGGMAIPILKVSGNGRVCHRRRWSVWQRLMPLSAWKWIDARRSGKSKPCPASSRCLCLMIRLMENASPSQEWFCRRCIWGKKWSRIMWPHGFPCEPTQWSCCALPCQN